MAVVARGRQKKTLGSRLMEIPRELWHNAGLYVMFIPAVRLPMCTSATCAESYPVTMRNSSIRAMWT